MLGHPPPSIRWIKDDRAIITGNGIIVRNNGSLIIPYSQGEHEGTYECLAANVGGESSQTFKVNVFGEFSDFISQTYIEIT